MDEGNKDDCNGASTNPAGSAAAASSSTEQVHDAGPANRDCTDASCQNNDLLKYSENMEEEDEEVFFGPVSEKEKQKASQYARRRTAVFRPGASGDHLRRRVTQAPSDLLPTLREMGTNDKFSTGGCHAHGDSLGQRADREREHKFCAAETSVAVSNSEASHSPDTVNHSSYYVEALVKNSNNFTFENTEELGEASAQDMEKALRRDSLLVIQELKNHRKDGKRCEDNDCSLCILDDDNAGDLQAKAETDGNVSVHSEAITKVNHSASVDHSHNQSVSISDGYNSDDDFLLMEQSCHESFDEDVFSPGETQKLDTTIDCITKSISKVRIKPSTNDRQSVHAFSRYTPVRQARLPSQETFVANTPENDVAVSPGVVFSKDTFSPNLMFKDLRRPLFFNEKCEEGHAGQDESSLDRNSPIQNFSLHKKEVPAASGGLESDRKYISQMNTTVDIMDVACHDKSCFDLNAIEGNTSSENSFEQDTSDSICSSEEGSNKENQPQVNSGLSFQTPPMLRTLSMRHAVSEQRPSSLQLQVLDDGYPLSPSSVESASPMTMEEILARKKAQMQQLRQEQQKFTERLGSRHSPSPARELNEKKGLVRSPLTGSFRSPRARLPSTLPRVRYKDSHSLALEGKPLEAVTKLHTMCNSQRSVKLIHIPRKAHSTRIVTVVADERQRIKWSDLKNATPNKDNETDESEEKDAHKSGKRRSIIRMRPKNFMFPYGDESPSSVIISKTAHHASSLQKAVIDKASTCN